MFLNFLTKYYLKCLFNKQKTPIVTSYRLTFVVMMTSASDKTWSGAPLSEMYGGQSPWDAPEFPAVSPSRHHSVLYHIPSYGLTSDTQPKPQVGKDKWDSDHVRMPCSKHSLYKVEDSNGKAYLKNRWELIECALKKPIHNSQELAEAILSYNTKFKGSWKFRAMHKLFDEYLEEEESQIFFDVTLPEIAKLALDLPKLIQAPIPLLKQHKNHAISLTQLQIASLLANAFFCTFPRRNTYKKSSEYASYPSINMTGLYENSAEHVLEKLKCICFYFKTVCKKASVGVVTFSRTSVAPRRLPSWEVSQVPLAATPLHVRTDSTIEDADGLIQLDFANKFLGGGVLNHGCVQEEIRFVICPELMLSMLFTEVLRPNEAVMIIGSERYSKYTGYGYSFQWAGVYCDSTPRDSSLRRRVAVLALDALPRNEPRLEYSPDAVARELNKAWVGFSFFTEGQDPRSLNYPGLASGNWGCGAFGGTYELKSLLQIMAASEARRPLAYFTFNDEDIKDYLMEMHGLMVRHNVTVGQLYSYLMQFHKEGANGDLPSFLRRVIETEQNKPKSDTKTNKVLPKMFMGFTFKKTREKPESSINTGESSEKSNIKLSKDDLKAEKTEVLPKDVPTTVPTAVSANCTVSSVKCDEQETIDLSTPQQSQEYALSSEVEKEFLKDSPDLFSEDEMASTKCQKSPTEPISQLHISQNKPKSSKLIDAMEKMDGQSRLNLSSPSPSPFKNTSINEINSPMNTSIDSPPTNPKKKAKLENNSKITDFFKKPV